MSAWMMLSWELVARHRRVFAATAIYSVLVCLVCPLLPQAWRTPDLMMALLAGPCARGHRDAAWLQLRLDVVAKPAPPAPRS